MTSIQISGLREDLETIELLSAEIFQENEISARTKISEFRADSIEADQILPVLTVTFGGVIAVVQIINLVLSIQEKKNTPVNQKKAPISIKIETNNGKEIDLKISGDMTDTEIKECIGSVQKFVDDFLVINDGLSLRSSENNTNELDIEKVNLLFVQLLSKLTNIREITSLPPIKDGERTIFKSSFDQVDLPEVIGTSEGKIFYLHLDEVKYCKDIFHILERENILCFHEISTDIRILDMQNVFVGYEIEKLPLFREVSCRKYFIFYESKYNFITKLEKTKRVIESTEMTISSDSIQKLLVLLRPYLQNENERRAYLFRALGMNAPVLNRLVWNVPVDVFITNMVNELIAFGGIAPGQPALCALLEVIREDVGVDVKDSIDQLLQQIREELQKAEITGNSLQTTDALIEQVEQYLSDPNRYTFLNSLVIQEAKAIAEVMQEELEACPWRLSTRNPSQCQQCLEYLEAKSERFVRILATIVHHDQNAQFITPIAKAFKILARQPLPGKSTFPDESRYVRLYPLALAIYAVFIIGVQEEKAQLLRTILSIPWNRQVDSLPNLGLVCVLNYLDGYSYSLFNAVLGGTPYFAPVAERIKRILVPWIEELLLDADVAFCQGEFVLGLADIEAKRPAYLSDGKRLSLEGTYLYQYKARRIISAFLHDSSHWLIDLYPSLEELLKTFDETASVDKRGSRHMEGFCRGALPAFREEVWY